MKTANVSTPADRDKAREVSKRLDEEIAIKTAQAEKLKDFTEKAEKAEKASSVAVAKLSELKSEINEREKTLEKLPDVRLELKEEKEKLAGIKKEAQKRKDLKDSAEALENTVKLKQVKVKAVELDIILKKYELGTLTKEEEKLLADIPEELKPEILFDVYEKEKKELEEAFEEEAKRFAEEKRKGGKESQKLVAGFRESEKIEKEKVKKAFDERTKLEGDIVTLQTKLEKLVDALENTDSEIKEKYAEQEEKIAQKSKEQKEKESLISFGKTHVNEAIKQANKVKLALEKIHGKPISLQIPQCV